MRCNRRSRKAGRSTWVPQSLLLVFLDCFRIGGKTTETYFLTNKWEGLETRVWKSRFWPRDGSFWKLPRKQASCYFSSFYCWQSPKVYGLELRHWHLCLLVLSFKIVGFVTRMWHTNLHTKVTSTVKSFPQGHFEVLEGHKSGRSIAHTSTKELWRFWQAFVNVLGFCVSLKWHPEGDDLQEPETGHGGGEHNERLGGQN